MWRPENNKAHALVIYGPPSPTVHSVRSRQILSEHVDWRGSLGTLRALVRVLFRCDFSLVDVDKRA